MVVILETHGLSKQYGPVKAVQRLDLQVDKGEIFGFLGLNGAGKTTTVQMLVGVLPPTKGMARVAGVEVTNPKKAKAVATRIGVVFGDNIAPEPGFSPVRYLRHFGRLYGLPKHEIDKRARNLFRILALDEYAERPIGQLSGGNKRKVELARALLHDPQVLFLDEPTRELDIPAKRAAWQFLRTLVEDKHRTIFLSSHDPTEIATLCDRIGVIQSGCLTWEGTPRELTGGKDDLVDALSAKLQGEPLHEPRARNRR